MLTISNEQRQYLALDGAPLPLVDYDKGKCYMLMPVTFAPTQKGRVLARVPGVKAVGEADQPTDALATLALVIKDLMEEFST